MNISSLQVIQGGAVRSKLVLNQHNRQSIADRFSVHDASLSTLAWETGYSQHTLCAVIVEIARAEGIEAGKRIARLTHQFPLAKAA